MWMSYHVNLDIDISYDFFNQNKYFNKFNVIFNLTKYMSNNNSYTLKIRTITYQTLAFINLTSSRSVSKSFG